MLTGKTVRWLENWLSGRAQRVGIHGAKSSWRPVAHGVPQGSLLGAMLFNLFISALDEGTECTLSKFAGWAKLGGVADAAEACAAIERDLARVEKWAERTLLKFTQGKRRRVLLLGRTKRRQQDMLGPTCWEAALPSRTWESWGATSGP